MQTQIKHKGNFWNIYYRAQQTFGFCAKCHIGGFSRSHSQQSYFNQASKEDKIETDDPKELALFLAKHMLISTGYTKTVISDIEDSGMHTWISNHLPESFDLSGTLIKVIRETPYRNRNSGNSVQEVVLHKV